MKGWARLSIAGRLTRDAELISSNGGSGSRLRFTVAHTPRARQGQEEHPLYVACTLFGARADGLAQYLLKGSEVHCSGDMELRPWKGNDGKEHQSLELNVRDLDLLGSKQAQPVAASGGVAPIQDDGDLPF